MSALLLSLTLFLSGSGFAAGPDTTLSADTTVALAELTVTATRLQTPSELAPSRVRVLTAERIEQTGAQNIAELLDKEAGVFIRQYGPGGLTSMSIRGAGASQSLILLDGNRIADPQLGQLDLSLLPTSILTSAEVLHGAGSPLYGSDAMGGVINLQTTTSRTAPSWMLSGTAGAFGERRTNASFSVGDERLTATGSFEYAQAENDFEFIDPSRFPPEPERRQNADRTQHSSYGTVAYEGEQQSLRVAGWFAEANRGLPGTAGGSASQERQDDQNLRLWSSYDRSLGSGTLDISGIVQRASRRYQNPAQEIDDTGQTLSTQLTSEWTVPLHPKWQFRSGVEGAFSQANHPNLADDAREGRAAIFALAEGEVGDLRLYPALRADAYHPLHAEARRMALNPRFGLNYELFSGVHLKAQGARAFRHPTFNDRFWVPGGNPDLQPERAWSADAGVAVNRGSHRAEVSSYVRHTRDEIIWQPTRGGHWAPHNVRQTLARGLEVSYQARQAISSLLRVDVQGQYALTDARNRSNPEASTYNKQLRYTPRHQASSTLSLHFGAVTLDVTGRYTGRRYVTSDESQHLAPFFVTDAQLRTSISLMGVRLNAALQVDNLTDAEYAVLRGYPMPGRHARMRISLSPN